ncbi:restriction endonuclease [Candidatus Woesearchaeota archaeon]|nr:restriction endonuclease [Candidatus Woesearchaeota archaeon]
MESLNYQEWQDIIGGIDDRLFEEICYRLLTKLGYEGVKPRGGSSDGGRDLEGIKIRLEGDGKTKYIENYWFECKCYSSTIPWKEISDKLHSARDEKVNSFIIMSNRGLSPQAQDKVKKYKESSPVRVIEWSGFPFLDILFQHKDLCDWYFPGYEIPSTPPSETKEKHIIKASMNIGQVFGIELEANIDKKIELNEENIRKIISDALRSVNYSKLGIPDKEKSQLYSSIAMTFLQFGHSSDALTFIDHALRLEQSTNNLINKGIILENLDLIEDSNKLYEEILSLEPNNSIAHNNLGHNYRRQYELKSALDHFSKAIEQDPNYLTAINNKAQTLKDLKMFDESLAFVDEQIDEKSSFVLQKTKIDVLLEALDLKEAFRLNDQLLKLYPNDIDLLNYKGVIYEHNAQYQYKEKYLELAYDAFGATRQKNPRFILAISNQVVCLMNKGNYEFAEIIVNEGFSQNNNDPFLLHNKSKIELLKGNFSVALNFVERAIQKKSLEKFLLTKCDVLLKLRKYSEVEKQCDRILKNDSKNSSAFLLKAESLRKRHEPTKAKLLVKKANKFRRSPVSLLEAFSFI